MPDKAGVSNTKVKQCNGVEWYVISHVLKFPIDFLTTDYYSRMNEEFATWLITQLFQLVVSLPS